MPRHERKQEQQQQRFDWTRADRRSRLDHLVIERFQRQDGTLVRSSGNIKTFLKLLEGFCRNGGEWTVGEIVLARSWGVTERTVRRTIADCEQLQLIRIKRVEGRASTYQIDWDTVDKIVADNAAARSRVGESESEQTQDAVSDVGGRTQDVAPDTPDNLTGVVSTTQTQDAASNTPDNCVNDHGQVGKDPGQLDRDPGQVGKSDEEHTYSSRARGLQPFFNHDLNHEIKPYESHRLKQNCCVRTGWPFSITRQHLQCSENVEALFAHAIRNGYVVESERMVFHKLAKYIVRQCKNGLVGNAGGYFTSRLKAKAWLGDVGDERLAIAAIVGLDEKAAGVTRPAQPSPADVKKAEELRGKIEDLAKAWGVNQ